MSVIIDFSIFPVNKGESLSPYAARAIKIIKESGLPHHISPMGTSIGVVSRCLEDLKKDCDRLYMTMKVDYRKKESGRIEKKIKSVEKKL